ncbi:hypothetical protein THAOC_28978 [Thalassiosira oceanica]|uniref:Uncharacterized protein n=1 Tax=Thalassiosira oceanica TaxID=159749 RepID=K0RYT6_THAOC|nr:hypothetical protein THAOC_28978 [Thalassiosira oceanica]|eukprot:EJK51817.1 hypothetical protein THAOC_28978 [Thalassiosira oceanica]
MPESERADDSGLEYTPRLPPWCTSGQYWPSPDRRRTGADRAALRLVLPSTIAAENQPKPEPTETRLAADRKALNERAILPSLPSQYHWLAWKALENLTTHGESSDAQQVPPRSGSEGGVDGPWAFFFLTAPLAITSYHTNKTRLAEAPFGPVGDDNGPVSEPAPHDRLRAKQHRAEAAPGPDGDDNGPGSEPPPHGRFRYVSTFVTSRRRPPAAVGKPSFTYFPVDCLPHDVLRPDEPTDL